MNNLKYWLALNYINIASQASVRKLLQQFGSPEKIFTAKKSLFKELKLAPSALALLTEFDWNKISSDLKWAESSQNHIIKITDADYPELLKQIPDPPIVLFVKGDKSLLNYPQLAIIGSRNPTPTGYETAKSFANYLAKCGLVITSGLALGIDAASHTGAIMSGKTIAVLGSGFNNLYPKSNKKLAEEIIVKGSVLVSEYPINESPKKENFPRRNRIISGLSVGTLVVEATLRSGSLITAKCALEQGREVFAIPGSIHNPLARGCHKLIRDGAKLVETSEDIFAEMHGLIGTFSEVESVKNFAEQNSPQKKLDAEYEKLLSSIGFEPTSIDLIAARTKLKPNEIASMLLILELEGIVKSVPGGWVRG